MGAQFPEDLLDSAVRTLFPPLISYLRDDLKVLTREQQMQFTPLFEKDSDVQRDIENINRFIPLCGPIYSLALEKAVKANFPRSLLKGLVRDWGAPVTNEACFAVIGSSL
jgi:hypothetical protein